MCAIQNDKALENLRRAIEHLRSHVEGPLPASVAHGLIVNEAARDVITSWDALGKKASQ